MNKDLTHKDKCENICASFGNRQSLSYWVYFSCVTSPFSVVSKVSSSLCLKFLFLFCSFGHLVCDCIFEGEFSNDQWVQEERDHSPQHKLIIGYTCPGQTAWANANRKRDPGRSLVNRRKHLQQFCQKSQINFIANEPELKRDLGTVCLLFTRLKYLGEKIKYLIIIFWCTAQ